MNRAYKIFCIIQAVFLSLFFIGVLCITADFSPVITGDVILDDSHLLTRSQMTGWIIWMNTVFMFGLACLFFLFIGRQLKQIVKD